MRRTRRKQTQPPADVPPQSTPTTKKATRTTRTTKQTSDNTEVKYVVSKIGAINVDAIWTLVFL